MTTSWPLKTSVSTPTTVPGITFTVKHPGLPASLYLPLGLNPWWPQIYGWALQVESAEQEIHIIEGGKPENLETCGEFLGFASPHGASRS